MAPLGDADALLVHVDGKPAGVVTRQDVLGHLAGLPHDGRTRDGRRMPASTPARSTPGRTPTRRPARSIPPLHLTTTYKQDGVGGLRGGYEYSRSGNPTRDSPARRRWPRSRRARPALAFASGLAAEDTLLRTVCRPGDHVVLGGDAYGGTFRLISPVLSEWGARVHARRPRRPRRRARRDAGRPPG